MKRPIKKLLNKAEQLNRQLTIIRANGQCERCHQPGYTEWCHYITRALKHLKCHKNNTFRWCKKCHKYLDDHPMEKQIWVIKKIGADAHDELHQLKNEIQKPTELYYQNQIDELNREINKGVCTL